MSDGDKSGDSAGAKTSDLPRIHRRTGLKQFYGHIQRDMPDILRRVRQEQAVTA
jgi:hypothetical protein